MSRTSFRVTLHSIVAWISRKSLLKSSAISEIYMTAKGYSACFEQEVPWDFGNYIVQIPSETCTWHDKNIQSNAPYRYLLSLRNKWLWVRILLQSLAKITFNFNRREKLNKLNVGIVIKRLTSTLPRKSLWLICNILIFPNLGYADISCDKPNNGPFNIQIKNAQ